MELGIHVELLMERLELIEFVLEAPEGLIPLFDAGQRRDPWQSQLEAPERLG